MFYFDFFASHPLAFALACGVLGLLVGSFLNVVIYRLPIMLEREWREQCVEFLADDEANQLELAAREPQHKRFDLIAPGSHCPKCQKRLRAWENIPLLSYLAQGRKCRHCGETISLRYPFVELLTGVLSFIITWHFGFSEQAAAGLLFTWLLISLSFIDYDTQLLPDVITVPMLWIGLLLSLFTVYVDPASSIIGAIAGYLALWSVFHGFKLATGKEGMGYGDFKLLAAMGAWLGWKMLPSIILLSSFAGAIIGIGLVLLKLQNKEKPIPFGPYLAIAAWLAMLYGDALNARYFQLLGV
ncbi:MAG TPA: prepilin peptidase [Gammaproteobacteria bacterium]|nr:prepilin peptidase [Gammaproteobacteria bacterium]